MPNDFLLLFNQSRLPTFVVIARVVSIAEEKHDLWRDAACIKLKKCNSGYNGAADTTRIRYSITDTARAINLEMGGGSILPCILAGLL